MANFGLSDLRLVAPARRLAAGARLGQRLGRRLAARRGQVFASLGEARCRSAPDARHHRAAARSAAAGDDPARGGAALSPPAAARGLAARPAVRRRARGAGNADIALCQGIVTVPVDLRFRSLNLAQAVAICAYEWRVAQDARRARRSSRTPCRRPTGDACSASTSTSRANSTPPASSTRRKSGRR